MRLLRLLLLFLFFSLIEFAEAQKHIDEKKFFVDTTLIKATLTTDLSTLINQKMKPRPMKAIFALVDSAGQTISEDIIINARGQFRRSECYVPPLKLDWFKYNANC